MSRYLLGASLRRCPTCGIEHVTQRPLTTKQQAIYDYLAEHQEQHGRAPLFAEIADRFGYRSLATVHEHLSALQLKGWISREHNLSQSIRCLVPLAGAA